MIHRRFMRACLVTLFSLIPIILSILTFYFVTKDTVSSVILAVILSLTICALAGYYLFCYYDTQKHNPGRAVLDYDELDTFIVKTDIWFFKRLLLFDVDGKYIGMTQIEITGLKSFLLSHLSHYKIIVPLLYTVYDYDGNIICMFKRRGFNSAVVNIYDENGTEIGTLMFDELHTLFKFSGTLNFNQQQYQVKSELFFEDADSGIMTLSSFKNRMAYHYIFRDMYNETAELAAPLSTDTGKAGFAVLMVLYYFRWK